jgi:hypothetical protein
MAVSLEESREALTVRRVLPVPTFPLVPKTPQARMFLLVLKIRLARMFPLAPKVPPVRMEKKARMARTSRLGLKSLGCPLALTVVFHRAPDRPESQLPAER